jgi:uncharacterized protein with HEPN domain
MFNDDALYLSHMLETARKAVGKLEGLVREDYDEDENLRLALTHLIQVIGEAAGRASQPTRTLYPEIPWREITGMRHRIVHDYLNVDEDVVWQVVVEDLPPLIALLEKIVSPKEK